MNLDSSRFLLWNKTERVLKAMADFYKRRDVQALLKHRKILFIGDSNVRPLYKDLIAALKQKELISVDTLKSPNVESYCGDIAVQQCGRKHEWTFWENRIFEEGPWRVEMFCTGRVMIRELLNYIFKLPEAPLSMPDVVYVSFNFSYGNTRSLVSSLLVNLKMKLPCNTLVLVGSSFPTTKDMFGDPRFDEVPFFTTGRLSRDDGTEEEVMGKVSSIGFHYLNIAHYLHKDVFRGVTTEQGWESVIIRYTTFLLLTSIANSLLIKTPNRVNQDVLHKAILSGNDETVLYNNLLLKHASNWLSVKTKNALTEEMDLAASNAYEITKMLWKIYHRSRGRSSSKQILGGTNKSHHKKVKSNWEHNRKTTACTLETGSIEKCGSERSRNADTILSDFKTRSISPKGVNNMHVSRCADASCKISEKHKTDTEERVCTNENIPVGNENLITLVDPSRMEDTSFAPGQSEKNPDNDKQEENSTQDDGESLEEGEIRESPSGSPNGHIIQTNSNPLNNLVSDISSSEGEMDAPDISLPIHERVVHPGVSSQHQYYQPLPALNSEYQNYYAQSYQTQVPTHNSGVARQIQYTYLTSNEPVVTIELSDEELVQEEKPIEEYCDAHEAIINLNSDEDSMDITDVHNARIELLQSSPEQKKRMDKQNGKGGKDKLCLMNAEGSLISWPTAITRSGPDMLWKWWRSHIERNNGSLILHHPEMENINGAIPSLNSEKKGACIAVPKIVDDIHQFLKCLEVIKIPEHVVDLNVNGNANEKGKNSKETPFKTRKLLPLAEELSRGSVKRINFEISKKKPQAVTARNRITIKEFASVRNLTAKATKKSDLNFPGEPKASSSSKFYSYGEQMGSISIPSGANARHGSPLGQWFTTSHPDTEEPKTKSTRVNKEVEVSSKPRKTKKSSSKSVSRREQKISSEEEVRMRWRDRSSSLSDRSSLRDRSPSEGYRHSTDRSSLRDRSPSEGYRHSTDRSRYRDHHWYSGRSLSDRSHDSSPSTRKWESPDCRQWQ